MMHPPRLFFFLLLLLLLPLLASSSTDVELLLEKVKPALQGKAPNHSNAQLATWNASTQLATWNASTPLCLWRGLRWATPDGRPLRCDNLSSVNKEMVVTSIRLPAAGIAGHLPPELGAFSALESVYLAANSLSGGIPLEVGNAPALTVLDLAGNALSGELPVSLWNLCDHLSEGEVRLHGNALSGAIPAPAGPNTTCDGLRVLGLGGNRFSGELPSFVGGFRGLQRLDLSHNNLSGQVPPALAARFPADSFLGNDNLCGPPLSRPCGSGPMSSSRGVAAMVIGFMAAAVVAASLCIGWASTTRWRNTTSSSRGGSQEAEESGEAGRLVVLEGGEHLTLEDVLNATGQALVDRRTSYCTVYKAKLASGGGSIELRLLREDCCRRDKWKEEEHVVRRIGRARHENLVPFRAFYFHQGRKLLVYDHFPRTRTLHHLLHQSPPGEEKTLTWPRRHKVALGVARALAYIHGGASECHGNVRSSAVLIDELFVPRLAEYALHRLLEPAAADAMMLSAANADGYRAPELHTMAKCTARTDVYAFGILLLELLMRKNPVSSSDDLPSLVKLAVMEEAPLEDLLDPEIVTSLTNSNSYKQILKLAMGCCAPVPASRPTMPEVVRQLQETRPSIHYSPTESRSDAGTPTAILPS